MISGLLLWAVCLTLPACLHALPVDEVYSFPQLPSPHSELVQGSDGAFYGTTYGGGSGGLGTVYRVTLGGGMTTLVEFNSRNGANPEAGMVLGPDGALYGTTSKGGRGGDGTVFRLDTNGVLATLVEFSGTNGALPIGRLAQGRDGALYGTTQRGADLFTDGTVFRVTTNGVFATLASSGGLIASGSYPFDSLVEGRDGAFYGTTVNGGGNACGTVFRVTTNGVLTTLVIFNGTNGRYPSGPLVEGHDGAFYGTTRQGGESGLGTVFRVTTNEVFSVLASFNQLFGSSGDNPSGPLLEGSDGAFYGTTYWGGSKDYGTVFRVTTNGVLTVLVSFDMETNGAFPQGKLAHGADGRIYGAASWTLFSLTTNGEFSVLKELDLPTVGCGFAAGLVVGSDGALYSTTEAGGKSNYGTAFRCLLNGEATVLAPFKHTTGGDVRAGLVLARDGAFYGTTARGGSNNWGTIFRLSQNGQLTTVATCQQESGAYPDAGLVEGQDGAFYGVSETSPGSVFRVTTHGDLTTLVRFGATNGAVPFGKLVQGSDGAFYGTTFYSGYQDTNPGLAVGYGTVFRMTTNGELATLAFFNRTNGSYPQGAMVQGFDGAFYGTTMGGGSYNHGIVFRVTPAGEITSLFSFDHTNGASPSTLVKAADGALYGTTVTGGNNGVGTIFKITTNGVHTILVHCNFSSSGAHPHAGLVQGRDGALYGTTSTAIFRMTTNGTLTILGALNTTTGLVPEGELVFGNDGMLYGTAHYGGSRGGGTIFRVSLAPRMQPPALWSYGARCISFTGIPGDSYRLLRASTIAGPWEPLASLTAAPDGSGSYIDDAAPYNQAFYRVVGP